MEALKKKFREGRREEAIAQCEALCRQRPADRALKRLCAMMHAVVQNHARSLELLRELRDPANEDADLLFNIGVCERELNHLENAARCFEIYTAKFPDHQDGWASLAECRLQLKQYRDAIALTDRAIALAPALLQAWNVRAHSQKAIGDFDNALASYERANRIQPTVESWLHAGLTYLEVDKPLDAIACFDEAIGLAPDAPALRITRGDTFQGLGKLSEAVDDYRAALKLAPTDDEALKKASVCLLQSNRADEAIALCRDILRTHPDMLTAKLGVEWVLSKLVPVWHVPMINEQERNQAYHDGLASVVTPDKLVFEIGTGSGLLAMMAAKLGARQVYTCETVGLIADTAARIVARNKLQNRIVVLAKSSHEVQLDRELPARADILVHEIFSSELLGEHVLPAIEDAKRRLLKPGGEVLPSAASIMIALVGGDELGRNLYVDESFGFDLRDFNAIHPKRRPLHREDLELVPMSDDIEAFRFDFAGESAFPPERKVIGITATKAGRCYGVVQWIRLELGKAARFENHPSRRRAVSNWQHTIYGFDEPIHLQVGQVVSVSAMHDRSRPWFELIHGRPRVPPGSR
jgi:tetratricopeptide (TPR) repeat protein